MCGRDLEIKEADKVVCFRSVVEKNDRIQNDKSERTGKASKFYHVAKSLLWNKERENVKLQNITCILIRYYYIQQRHGHVLRDWMVNKQLR
jgi:hypothetical protein